MTLVHFELITQLIVKYCLDHNLESIIYHVSLLCSLIAVVQPKLTVGHTTAYNRDIPVIVSYTITDRR